MFSTEIVLAAIERHGAPVTSSELVAKLADVLDQNMVYKTLSYLAGQGLIEKLDRLPVPEELRRKGSPKTALAYQIATASTDPDPVPSPDLDAELAKALREHVEAAEDPFDPEVALDPPDQTIAMTTTDWPDAIERRHTRPRHRTKVGAALRLIGGPRKRERRYTGPDDPVILEIEREGYRLLEPQQQSRMIAARVQAGLPFIGQALAEKVPTWWSSLEELVAIHLEDEADEPMQEAA